MSLNCTEMACIDDQISNFVSGHSRSVIQVVCRTALLKFWIYSGCWSSIESMGSKLSISISSSFKDCLNNRYSVRSLGSPNLGIRPNRLECGSASSRCFLIASLQMCFKFRLISFCKRNPGTSSWLIPETSFSPATYSRQQMSQQMRSELP